MYINYPVNSHEISQEFGRDTSNDAEYKKFYELFDNKHCGVDFPVAEGTEIYASFQGIVVRNENHKGMGNVVGIRNGNVVALYAHLSRIKVALGKKIVSGELVGISGSTGGACTNPHLHFELRDISKPTLKEMVFKPNFDEIPYQYTDTFTYQVNNTNTKKTLKALSILYFGTSTYWEKIREINNLKIDGDILLQDGLNLVIPNYK